MTEQHDNTSNIPLAGSESHADGPEGLPEGTDTGEQESVSQGPNSKEARYRIRAREAETALAVAQERVELMNRREITRLAGEHLSVGEDIFVNGNSTESYLTEDGDVDADKVAADVAAVLAERPGLRKRTPGYDPSQGYGGRPSKGQPSWGEMFQS